MPSIICKLRGARFVIFECLYCRICLYTLMSNVYFDCGTLGFLNLKKWHFGNSGGTFGFFNFRKVTFGDFCQHEEANLGHVQCFLVEIWRSYYEVRRSCYEVRRSCYEDATKIANPWDTRAPHSFHIRYFTKRGSGKLIDKTDLQSSTSAESPCSVFDRKNSTW